MNKNLISRFLASIMAVAALFAIVLIPAKTARADVKIEDVFKDPNFRKVIYELFDNRDEITDEEIANLKKLDVSGCNISSLEGLEIFTGLEELDVSNNPISVLITTDIYHLKKLNASNCPDLKTLEQVDGFLQSIDITNDTKLTELILPENYLTKIDLNSCTALEKVVIQNNKLESIDLSNLYNIDFLRCEHNQIEKLILGDCPKLEYICADDNLLTAIDTTQCPELKTLEVCDNKFTALDVSMNIKLEELRATGSDYNIPNKKIYVPKDSTKFKKNDDYTFVSLTTVDWVRQDTEWIGDEENGYTGANIVYKCRYPGEEDYEVHVPSVFVMKIMQYPTCVDSGFTTYFANIDSSVARDGKEFSDDKTLPSPPAKGHKWGEWTVVKKATVDEEGSKTRICLNDPSHVDTVSIPKLTPTSTPKPTVEPSVKPTVNPTSKPTAKPTSKLSLNESAANIVCGKTLTLKATLKDSTSTVTWKSSDSKIATVDKNGKITAKMAGSVTITASADGQNAECKVTVLYKDVTKDSEFWFAPTNYLTASGVVKGYDKQTNFKPANDCTRAQMVTFLWRLQGEPKPKASKCKFPDVKTSDYFYKPVIWAVEQGITTGYSDGKFKPQNVCTRAQTVTFLWRMADKPDPKTTKCKFTDVTKKDYFYKAVIWASEKKIVAGYEDNTFKPQGKCLRRQMVTFLYKYDKYVNGKG